MIPNACSVLFLWQSAGIERSIVLPGTLAVPDEPDSPNRDSSKASSTVRRFVLDA